MSESHTIKNDFLNKITEIIEDNLSNEQFGVSELADEIGMSRSNLLRKVKKLTNLSVSLFIRQVRLRHAMEMLKETSLTVSEVSFKVGFSSPSYFIKCFREQYGYPPGEAGKNDLTKTDSISPEKQSQSHQLAAIMFTDIQGYTALMQQDEEKAVSFRNRHREIFKAVTHKFNGKILQYYGDGTLSTFNSAIDAVRCGSELQLAFQSEPQIPVRIGIHSGDIIFTEDDIIGDGVNVASRIESLAVVGSVLISEKVYDEVKNQSGIQTNSLGKFELKNVEKSMEVYALSNSGLVIPRRDQIISKLKSESIADNKGFHNKSKWFTFKWVLIPLVAIIIGFLIYNSGIYEKYTKPDSRIVQTISKKSIAVLPFINDSNDSTNVYIINGLMESILNNLQKIQDLKVVSRTSVEKFRNTQKLIPEIARELNVNYVIEGSGQKIGDQILLNVQLIEALNDKHLWAEQYNRETKDIFKLQAEVAKNIADKIEVIITPEEEERINKPPTENLVAYDYFLKGLDFLYKDNHESIIESISWFQNAIKEDPEFARAYADIAIAYYRLDIFLADKKYSDSINSYADKALLFDSQLPQSLIAKALFYMNAKEYEKAIPHLEKALEYNPNSAMVINTLTDFYTNYVPNTEKYLEFALKGIQLDLAAHDSVTASYIFLHVSNAFIQNGFVEKAEMYINKSLDYNPENLYSAYVKAYILYAKGNSLQQTIELLIQVLDKDSTRLDVLQEVAKIYYYMRDYNTSYQYYKKFTEAKEAYNLHIYPAEDAKIGLVYSEVGQKEESEKIFQDYLLYAENDKSIYKHLSLAVYYSFLGEKEKSIEQMKLFAEQDHYQYWIILFLKIDPLVDNIKDLPEFKQILKKIESKFWKSHEEMKVSLEEKGLL